MQKKGRHFYEFGPFRLDPARRLLFRQKELIPLTPKVLHTLLVLVENRGRPVAKDEIIKAVWPDTFVEEANLTQNISTLRKVLGESPTEHAYVQTIPKQGYRFVAEVKETGAPGPPRGRRWLLWTTLTAAALAAVAGFRSLLDQPGRSEQPLILTPVTSYPGLELHPSLSPDGNQVAFDWDGLKQDNVDIYVKALGSDRAVRLTVDPARDFRPAWSPDGRSIAFLRALPTGRAAVLVIPATGGSERNVAVVHPGFFGSYYQSPYLEWSPDSRWVLTTDKNSPDEPSSLFLISVNSGEKRRLTSPPLRSLGDTTAAFSSEGRTLAFSRNQAATLGRFCVLAMGSDLRGVGEPHCFSISDRRLANFGSLRWSRDGQEIIFSALTRGLGQSGLWTMAVPKREGESGVPQRLPIPSESARDPVVSSNGRRLVYSNPVADTDIWRLQLPDPKSTQPAIPVAPARLINSTHYDWGPQYSPDGERMLFLSSRSGRPAVWVARKDGSNPTQVTALEAPLTGAPRWSPDGRRIAFDSTLEGHFDVYVVNADGGGLRRLTDHPVNDAVPSWSGDGQWIYFVSTRSGNYQIWKMRTNGTEPMKLTKQGGQGAVFESADGKFVYYAKSVAGATALWKVPAAGGDEVQVLESVWPLSFSVVRSGIYFMAPAEYGSSIGFLDFQSGKVTNILSVDGLIQPGVSVSPDGRFLLYSSGELTASDLMLAENFR